MIPTMGPPSMISFKKLKDVLVRVFNNKNKAGKN
jgi:hypothetical protein